MHIDGFSKLLPRPSLVRDVPTEVDWQKVPSNLCVPDDYKSFLSAYGVGAIDGWLWLLSPSSKNENLNLTTQNARQENVFRQADFFGYLGTERKTGSGCPGVVVFGISDNGDLCCWEWSGNTPTILVVDPRAQLAMRFSMTTLDFLAGLITKKLRCKIFPDDFPSDSPVYVTQ